MLPPQPLLKENIKLIIDTNPYQGENSDSEKAVDYFCDQMSKLILQVLNEAQVVLLPGSVNTVVTTAAGAGTGINIIPANGSLK
jgi:hypothetical protein